ncbi:endo alpha-1,4 polygalactosaminidase [Acidobacteriota bacterium]
MSVKKRLSWFMVILFLGFSSACEEEESPDYRSEMRAFVQSISSWAKSIRTGFLVIPQNGSELITLNGTPGGLPLQSYLDSIDGQGQEDLYYGYNADDQPTPSGEIAWLEPFLDTAVQNGVEVLVTDYCRTISRVDDSYARNTAKGYVSFAAPFRELHSIPTYPAAPNNINTANIFSLKDLKNFLYLINPSLYVDKAAFLNALQDTDYDLLIIDLFFDGTEILTPQDIISLKFKSNGAARLVVAYCSIGEAEDYRYYWQPGWGSSAPQWLAGENPNWPGNYSVRFWQEGWQDIIYGSGGSYIKRIIDAGFDGVYLDKVDVYEYFEEVEKVTRAFLNRR